MKKWIGLIFILLTVASAQAIQTIYDIETDSKRTILDANTANDTEEYANINAFVLQSGLNALDIDYGTFLGSLLPDDSYAKVLFQTIETELESVTTKTDFVTVTQAVNLDTMESDIANNNTFRITPSTEITAGTNIDWVGNTLNVIGGGSVNISGTPLTNDYARWINADTIEGRSYTEVKTDLGLSNVDNTTDLNKPISTLTQSALDGKADSLTTDENYVTDDQLVDIGNLPAVVSDETITTTDNTTNNVSTSKHGFAPKGDGSATSFLNGLGAYTTPSGGGNVSTSGTPVTSNFAKFVNGTDIEGRTYAEVKTDLSLDNVDNTTDLNKPVSTDQQTEIDTKEDDLGTPASDGYILSSTTGDVRSWIAFSTVGDVVGPASAVDSNLAGFDTTTGKLIKDSGIAAANVATLDGTQEITGDKTFSGDIDTRNATANYVGPPQYGLSADLPDTDQYKEFLMSGITGLNDGNVMSLWDGTQNLYMFWSYGIPVNLGDHPAYNPTTDRMEITAASDITWQSSDPSYSDESGLYINITDGDAFEVDQNVGISTWTTTYTEIPVGVDYYVASAADGGSDANDGLTTGTPWETIGKVNATDLLRGDTVYLNRDDAFDERLNLDDSGIEGEPITYSSYGTGALPIIRQVYQRDTVYGAISNVTIEAIHIEGTGATFGENGFDMSGTLTNVTVQNCEISNHVQRGFLHQATASQNYTNLILDNNNVHDNGLEGVLIQAGDTATSTATISNNVFTYNVDDCTESTGGNHDSLTAGGGTALIENNYIDSANSDDVCYGSGIDLVYRTATVRYNTIEGTPTHTTGNPSAFSAKTYDGDFLYLYGNTMNGGRQTGVELTSRDDVGGTCYVYNNVIAYNTGCGLLRQNSSPIYLENNIFYENGEVADRYNKSHIFTNWIDTLTADPRLNINSDNNMFYSSYGIPINRNRDIPTDSYDTSLTLAQWQAEGHGANSTEQDPTFVSAATGNFRLDTGSPALLIGAILGAPYDYGIAYDSVVATPVINLLQRLPASDMGVFQAEVSGITNWETDPSGLAKYEFEAADIKDDALYTNNLEANKDFQTPSPDTTVGHYKEGAAGAAIANSADRSFKINVAAMSTDLSTLSRSIDEVSVGFWVYHTGLTASRSYFSFSDSSNNQILHCEGDTGLTGEIVVNVDGSTTASHTSTTQLALNTLYFVGISYSASSAEIYIYIREDGAGSGTLSTGTANVGTLDDIGADGDLIVGAGINDQDVQDALIATLDSMMVISESITTLTDWDSIYDNSWDGGGSW